MKADIRQRELTRLKNSANFVANYRTGIDHLRESGVFDFLRLFARPYIVDGGVDINRSVASAHFCDGYFQALEDLLYFEETVISPFVQQQVIPTFGATRLALQRGDITLEDIKK